MFRVAAIIKNGKIRDAVEISAINLIYSKNEDSIKKAEEIIRFAEAVGEIKPINVRVLVRELNNLKKLNQEEDIHSVDLDLSSFFNKQATGTGLSEETNVQVNYGKGTNVSGGNNAPENKDRNTTRASLYNSGQKLAEYGKNQGRRSSFNQDKIFTYIAERGQARLKELESIFPEVSGRTLRRATDLLIKDGKIERVGNPGPSSYYRPLGRPAPSEADSAPSVAPSSSPVIQEEAGIRSPHPDPEIPVSVTSAESLAERHVQSADKGNSLPIEPIPAQIGTFQRIAPPPSFMRAIPADSTE